MASYSNYGECVDICAPGSNIISARMGGGLVSKTGTSMAAPCVAGAISLICSSASQTYTCDQVKNILYNNAIKMAEVDGVNYYGNGMVNLQYAFADFISSEVEYSNTEFNHSSSFWLTLSSVENSTIIYTLDGSTPSLYNGNIYINPIKIDKSCIIKAKTFMGENLLDDIPSNDIVYSTSATKTCKYLLDSADIENAFIVDLNTLISYRGILEDIVIPESIDGEIITTIGPSAFKTNSQIKTVSMSSKVITISSSSFEDCVNLKSIDLSKVLNTLNNCFANCKSLETANISTTNYVYSNAFNNCISLKSVNARWASRIYACAFSNCSSLETADLSNAKYIYEEAFKNCTNLSDIASPKVTEIQNNVFENCSSLKSINSKLTTKIGEYCFQNCKSLESLDMPLITTVPYRAFYNCRALTSVNIPKVENIGTKVTSSVWSGSCFASCASLSELYLPSINTIVANSFIGSGLTKLVLGDNFSSCTGKDGNKNVTIYAIASNANAIDFANTNGWNFVTIDQLSIVNNIPTSLTSEVNKKVSLTFETSGYNQTYQWYKTTNEDGSWSSKIVGATSNTYEFDATLRYPSYYYYCIATNWDLKTITSNLCKVDVYKVETSATITFNTNGGSAVSNMVYTYGKEYNLPTTQKTGYTFAGWTLTDNSSDNSFITKILSTDTGSKVLYAKWILNSYIVTFSNGTGYSITATKNGSNFQSGETATIEDVVVFRITASAGYTANQITCSNLSLSNNKDNTYTLTKITQNTSVSGSATKEQSEDTNNSNNGFAAAIRNFFKKISDFFKKLFR